MLIVFLDQILPHLLSADLLFLVDWLYLSHQGLFATEEGALELGVLFLVDALGASRCSRSVVWGDEALVLADEGVRCTNLILHRFNFLLYCWLALFNGGRINLWFVSTSVLVQHKVRACQARQHFVTGVNRIVDGLEVMREVNGLPGCRLELLLGLRLILEHISCAIPDGRVGYRWGIHEVTEVVHVDFFVALESPSDSGLHGIQLLVTVHVASKILIVVQILYLLEGILAEEFYSVLWVESVGLVH